MVNLILKKKKTAIIRRTNRKEYITYSTTLSCFLLLSVYAVMSSSLCNLCFLLRIVFAQIQYAYRCMCTYIYIYVCVHVFIYENYFFPLSVSVAISNTNDNSDNISYHIRIQYITFGFVLLTLSISSKSNIVYTYLCTSMHDNAFLTYNLCFIACSRYVCM